jgi:hypothetical protein
VDPSASTWEVSRLLAFLGLRRKVEIHPSVEWIAITSGFATTFANVENSGRHSATDSLLEQSCSYQIGC